MNQNARYKIVVAFALVFISATRLFAFQSTQKQTVAAGVFVGGTAAGLKIHHDALPAGSLVTKQFVILGEAGDETPVPPPPFNQRLTSSSDFAPIETRVIRIRIKYRFLTPEQFNGDELPPNPLELPVVEGADPTSFAFQIPADSFTSAAPILQYRIIAERISYSNGVQTVVASVSQPPISAQNTEPWVTVNAQANAANTFGAQGGRLSLPDGNPVDGESAVDIPAGIFTGPTVVTLDEVPLGSSLIPSPYNGGLKYFQATSDQPFRGLAQVALLYPDFEFPVGANGVVDGTDTPVRNLAIFVWDGFKWRRLGGQVDTRTNTIRARTEMFGFFTVAAAPPMSAAEHRPDEKIITPNGDNVNDKAFFGAEFGENYKIEIFDIKGHRVKTIMTGSSASWDGRNDSGDVVESGLYIYQYEVDGKRISGFIAVAK